MIRDARPRAGTRHRCRADRRGRGTRHGARGRDRGGRGRFEEIEVTEEDEQKLAALEAELAGLRERPPVVSDEDRTSAIGFMILGEDGVARLSANLYRPPDPDGPSPCPGSSGRPAASA